MPILRLTLSQPNIRSMLLRYRYFERSNSLGSPGLSLRLRFVAGSQTASGNGLVLAQALGTVALVWSAISGSDRGDDLVCHGDTNPDLAVIS